MALNSIDRETTINGALTALTAVGIEPPALPEYTALPACATTVEDIADAVRASKAADPYSDPRVQKLWIARQVGTASWLYESNRNHQSEARAQALINARPGLTAQLAEKFDAAAEKLTAAAQVIGNRENIRELSPGLDRPEEVHAALDVQYAEQAIEDVLRVRAALDSLAGPRMEHGGNTAIFGWANPTPAERQRIGTLGRETPWNTARAGVALAMAEDREELATRIREHETAQQRARTAQVRQAEAARRTR
ncbi:hypothetical protein [Kocuria sp. CPCC 204721]|uniref:hypothetical protein n=1 Tax=Kocuria sp. CPCC 204721 TaxID=3073548 RepID=UPI0034D430FB